MAILKFGELVAGIRGTIGGTIYSANKSGPFARGWSKGSNPRTPNQTAERAITSSHASYWRDLAQGDRDDWDTYAADPAQELFNSLGESYFATGWNWFCYINTHLILADRGRRPVAPVTGTPATPTIATAFVKIPLDFDSRAQVQFASGTMTGYDCIVRIAFGPSPALLWKSRGYLFVNHDIQNTLTKCYIGNTTQDLFGDPILNSKCFVAFARQSDQGRRSAWDTFTDLVVEF